MVLESFVGCEIQSDAVTAAAQKDQEETKEKKNTLVWTKYFVLFFLGGKQVGEV